MVRKFLLLILLLNNWVTFSSDSKSSDSDSNGSSADFDTFEKTVPRHNVHLLRSDADFAPDYFKAFERFSASTFTRSVKDRIIRSDLSLRFAYNESGEDFKTALIQRAIEEATSVSVVDLRDLDSRLYRSTSDLKN